MALEEREEELYEIEKSDWSKLDGWNDLSEGIKGELLGKKLKGNYQDQKYDEVLRFKLKNKLKGVRNKYLTDQTGISIDIGIPIKLYCCSCCGLRTFEKDLLFEICTVCWWENDGVECWGEDEVYNERLENVISGVNGEVTLAEARYNFLVYGIFDPERTDLVEYLDEPQKYHNGK